MTPDDHLHRPLIAGLYVRVSTGRQEQEETIEVQLDEIKLAIGADGNELPDENIFMDDGWPGEFLQRPDLDRMRQAAMEGHFEILYVYDRGRISRIFAHQEVVIEEIESRGLTFRSLHDFQATTPEEKVMQAMQGVFHQYERVKITERFRLARLSRARSGVLVNGHLPYGYNRYGRSGTDPARAEVNEDQAVIIRQIRTWFGLEGWTVFRIIEELTRRAVASPRGGRWSGTTVRGILRSATYHTGIVYFNKTEVCVPKTPRNRDVYKKIKRSSCRIRPQKDWLPLKIPPLAPDDGLYERIQRRFAEHQCYAPKNRTYSYLLSGKIRCACGAGFIGDGHRDHHYYRCTKAFHKYRGFKTCNARGINAHALDSAVWSELVDHLKNPALLEREASAWLSSQTKASVGPKDGAAQQGLTRLAEEERRYIKAYGAGTISFEQLQRELKELKRQKAVLVARQSEVGHASLIPGKLSAHELSRQATNTLGLLNEDNKVELVRELVDQIFIRNDHQAEVTVHLPIKKPMIGEKHGHRHAESFPPHLEFSFQFPLPRPKKGPHSRRALDGNDASR